MPCCLEVYGSRPDSQMPDVRATLPVYTLSIWGDAQMHMGGSPYVCMRDLLALLTYQEIGKSFVCAHALTLRTAWIKRVMSVAMNGRASDDSDEDRFLRV